MGKSQPGCSYKVCSGLYKKKRVYKRGYVGIVRYRRPMGNVHLPEVDDLRGETRQLPTEEEILQMLTFLGCYVLSPILYILIQLLFELGESWLL